MLILGSMPGEASLQAGQYYAHPRNLFWRILGELLCEDYPALPYDLRIASLIRHGIALWDVLQSCERHGSLDSAIATASIRINDLAGFLHDQPGITRILFNGSLAEQCFRRHLRSVVDATRLQTLRMPSTSPAHAALGYARKLEQWREGLADLVVPVRQKP